MESSSEHVLFPDRHFFAPHEGRLRFMLDSQHPTLFGNDFERSLIDNRVAELNMPVGEPEFIELIELLEHSIDEHPELLNQSYVVVDHRLGNDAGYVRKEAKYDNTGRQKQDPKSLFHFNEDARQYWAELFASAPADFRELLEAGAEVQDRLIAVARTAISQLEDVHPRIPRAYFEDHFNAHRLVSHSYLRVLSYDAYDITEAVGTEVAKPHFDIGGFTIQAYADAPGFWGSSGPSDERRYYPSQPGRAHFFAGIGHRNLYEGNTDIQPLYHGVERIIPEGQTHVERRHAVILFVDTPFIDPRVRAYQTLPEIS